MNLFRRRSERPMNCMQVGRRLQRYLDGDVDDLTARRIMRHLEDCRRCGMEAATYTEPGTADCAVTKRGGSPPTRLTLHHGQAARTSYPFQQLGLGTSGHGFRASNRKSVNPCHPYFDSGVMCEADLYGLFMARNQPATMD